MASKITGFELCEFLPVESLKELGYNETPVENETVLLLRIRNNCTNT